jgi:hypothetical protein
VLTFPFFEVAHSSKSLRISIGFSQPGHCFFRIVKRARHEFIARRGPSAPHLPETGSQFLNEQLGLLKSREVAPAVQSVPVNQVQVALFRPAPRHPDNLLRKDAAPHWNAHRLPGESPKLSQYSRDDDAALRGSQYSITSSNISSRVSTFSGFPWQSVHAQNFSRIHAACPAGESASP